MSDDDDNIISFEDSKDRPRQMITDNGRKFSQSKCPHDGAVIVNGKEANVECKDCGAFLNPIYVLQLLAAKESYYIRHVAALNEHLKKVKEEIKGRARTKCTHCGNMTAIKYKDNPPQTWLSKPDY
ncbi:hypothetical protein [Paremcibacter congregatus]|uniref:hypothetical protein n=1 Tax=Paremcibacter congregatus TaxID=2043170 RepID=UPI0030EDDC58|tara:strand:+ start:1299 stop:1676 length:378 start_codon:yes stop_codon:yes gene_type:complete